MNGCTLVTSARERVTVGGGCRSSGANASLRATLRGGRASAGTQSSATARSPPLPSSTITITEGSVAVKLRQRMSPRSVVTVPLASASQSASRAVPPVSVPAVFRTTRPIGKRDWSCTTSVRLIVHPRALSRTSIVAPSRPLPMNALSPHPVGRRSHTKSWRARNAAQSTGPCRVRSAVSENWRIMAGCSRRLLSSTRRDCSCMSRASTRAPSAGRSTSARSAAGYPRRSSR